MVLPGCRGVARAFEDGARGISARRHGARRDHRDGRHAGRAFAAELAAGIYLVARIETAPQNEDVLVDPVLVGVPTTVDGKLEYDVVAYPKFEDVPGLEPDRPGGLIPGFDLPTTGDMQLALVGVLLLLGTATLWSSRRVAEGSSDSSAS